MKYIERKYSDKHFLHIFVDEVWKVMITSNFINMTIPFNIWVKSDTKMFMGFWVFKHGPIKE
jgi:hypothetical protein